MSQKDSTGCEVSAIDHWTSLLSSSCSIFSFYASCYIYKKAVNIVRIESVSPVMDENVLPFLYISGRTVFNYNI